MNQRELIDAFQQDRREQVDVRLGQIPLSPTIGKMGNYTVVAKGYTRNNVATQLASALAQVPQIAGQFKTLQEQAGIEEAQKLTEEEIIKRANAGDMEATGFLKSWGKQRAFSRQFYNQYFDLEIKPELDVLEATFNDMSPRDLEALLSQAGGGLSAMNDDDLQDFLEIQYRDKIAQVTSDVELDDHQKVLHNQFMQKIPALATKSLAALRKKQKDFVDQTITQETDAEFASITVDPFDPNADAVNTVPVESFDADQAEDVQVVYPDLVAAATSPGIETQPKPSRAPVAESKLQAIRGELTVYSPQKGGDKMEGGYESSRPGPDGRNIVRTVQDYDPKDPNSYITLAGNPQYYGRSYIIPKLPYQDPKTGKVTVLQNVRGVVHDTGSAFKTAPEGRFDIPFGKDLNNKQMGTYNGLLNKTGVEFVPEKAKDAEPGLPGRKGKKGKKGQKGQAPVLTAEEHRLQETEKYNKYVRDQVSKLSNVLSQRIATAQNSGSSFTDRQIEDATIRKFANVMEYMIDQGDDQMAIAEEFLDEAGKGNIFVGSEENLKALNKTSAGQRLIKVMNDALYRKEQQISNEEKENKVGEKASKAVSQKIAGLYKLQSPDSEQPLTSAQIKDNISNIRGEIYELMETGTIDNSIYKKLLGELEIMDGTLKEGLKNTMDYIDPDFGANLVKVYGMTDIVTDSKHHNAFLTALETLGEDIEIYKQVKTDDFGNSDERLKSIFQSAPIKAAKRAQEVLFSMYRARYKEEGLDPLNNRFPGVASSEFEEQYQQIYNNEVRKVYKEDKEKMLGNARLVAKDKVAPSGFLGNLSPEEMQGLPPEKIKQAELRKFNESSEGQSDALDANGKLVDESLFEFKETYLNKTVQTFTNENSLKVLKEHNDISKIQQFATSGHATYYDRVFRVSEVAVNNPEQRAKRVSQFFNTANILGAPMSVHKNKGIISATLRSPQQRAGSAYGIGAQPFPPETYTVTLNSQNRLETPEAAENIVYNIEATLKSLTGNVEDMKIIYNAYFKPEKLSFEKFVDLQQELGRKLGWIEAKNEE